jgi:hypothetical protein
MSILLDGTAGITYPDATSTASAFPLTSVRQTVQQGPGTNVPSFLPSTSGSLSITSQNISTGVNALVVSAAAGFGSAGPIDYIGIATSNLTWSGLTASSTVFLGVTVSNGTLTTFSTTLAPIYQYGGTISTTNGQYTFDYAAMRMWLGNGSSASQVTAVFVGETVTSGSAVTSTVAYNYNGYYDSGWIATLFSAVVSKNHNIGTTVLVKFFVQNLTSEHNYNVGDIYQAFGSPYYYSAGAAYGPFFWSTRNTCGATPGASGAWNAQITDKSTGYTFNPTLANWAYKFIAQRSW